MFGKQKQFFGGFLVILVIYPANPANDCNVIPKWLREVKRCCERPRMIPASIIKECMRFFKLDEQPTPIDHRPTHWDLNNVNWSGSVIPKLCVEKKIYCVAKTVKISLFKLSKFPFSNFQIYLFQTIKISDIFLVCRDSKSLRNTGFI
jgi:hypothetical protein